jgi:NADP-dependent 3-hydroxy acid dehydrogenase YdfG
LKKLVVTGATKGIGRAIAEKYLSEGFEVAVCARNANELSTMQRQAAVAGKNGTLHTFVCDVTDKEQLKAFYAFVDNKMGTIDILVNNAGLFEPGKIYEEPEGVLERQIATNLYSAYYLSRMFLPAMIARRSGHVFNICSVASIRAYPNGGSYCISKFALYGMTKVLREEMMPHNIKVTAILPGATFSGSWEGTDLPEDRFMQAKDVAEAVYGASQLSPSAVIEEILMRPSLGDI